ncbi:MAG: HEAT repeat domain-containing protein [Planctomycetota bacterium]|jgi:hypothetical protein
MSKDESSRVLEHMREKTSGELHQILQEHDLSQWTEEALEAIRQVLLERGKTSAQVKKLEEEKDMDGLIALIATSNFSDDEKKEAAVALGRIKAVESVGQLQNVVSDDSMSFSSRSNAIRALGEIASPQAVNQLVESLEDPIEAIRDEAFGALQKIEAPLAKESLQMRSCEVCDKEFPKATGKRTLCPSCFSMDKITGWLYLFIPGILISCLDLAYLSLLVRNTPSKVAFPPFGIFAMFLLIAFFLLVFRLSIARKYMIILSIVMIIVSAGFIPTKEQLDQAGFSIEQQNEMNFNFVLYFVPLFVWLFYFWRSRRVRIVYRKKP